MKSLDINLLLRLVLKDVPEQTAKVEELLTQQVQTYAVADMAFAEIVWILQGPNYKYDRARIATNILAITAISHINCNRAMLERAVPVWVKHSSISFADACLATYAELNGATPLLTFDKKLIKSLPKITATL